MSCGCVAAGLDRVRPHGRPTHAVVRPFRALQIGINPVYFRNVVFGFSKSYILREEQSRKTPCEKEQSMYNNHDFNGHGGQKPGHAAPRRRR